MNSNLEIPDSVHWLSQPRPLQFTYLLNWNVEVTVACVNQDVKQSSVHKEGRQTKAQKNRILERIYIHVPYFATPYVYREGPEGTSIKESSTTQDIEQQQTIGF